MKPNLPALRRLLVLLRAPELPRGIDQFDMTRWKNLTTSCGTSACAAGLAASDGWFRKRKLYIRSNIYSCNLGHPAFRRKVGYDAVEAFFRLSTVTTHYIFSPFRYRGQYGTWTDIPRSAVAKRVAAVIARHS